MGMGMTYAEYIFPRELSPPGIFHCEFPEFYPEFSARNKRKYFQRKRCFLGDVYRKLSAMLMAVPPPLAEMQVIRALAHCHENLESRISGIRTLLGLNIRVMKGDCLLEQK